MIPLNNAPADTPLKIVEIVGGHGVRRRLLSLSFHKNHIIKIDKRSIMGGPILIKNRTAETTVALGRGIAGKILVEIVE